MSKQLTSKQKKQLQAVKHDGNERVELTALMPEFGLSYNQIYQRWWYLMQRSGAVKKSPKNALKRAYKKRSVVRVNTITVQKGKIVPYVLEKNVVITARGDAAQREEVMRKLEPVLLAMEVRKHTIPIFTSDIKAFRTVVAGPQFKTRVYGVTKIADNKKMMRIYRKL